MNTRLRLIIPRVLPFVAAAVTIAACGPTHPIAPGAGGRDFGCGDVFVYRIFDGGLDIATISASRSALTLSASPQTFDLAVEREGLTVALERYPSVTSGRTHCNDVVLTDEPKPVIWKVISGIATISIHPDSVPMGTSYFANVKLSNVTFKAPNGETTTVDSVIMKDVVVGWYPG